MARNRCHGNGKGRGSTLATTVRGDFNAGKTSKARSLGNNRPSSFLFDCSAPPGSGVFAFLWNLRHLFCSLGNQGGVQVLRQLSLGYENTDSEGEGMETYQTMRHETDMGYESKGRLTWIPPAQTSTVSLEEKTELVPADDNDE